LIEPKQQLDSSSNNSQKAAKQEENNIVKHDHRSKLESTISQHARFAYIYLGWMNLTDQNMPLIIRQAVRYKQCIRLSLENNRLTSTGLTLLIDELIEANNISLWWLDLSFNTEIGYAGCQHLARLLQSQTRTLTYLILQDTGMTDSGFELLIQALCVNSSLEELNVTLNKLVTDNCVCYVISMLERNHTLKVLQLFDCGLSETGKNQLKEAVAMEKMKNDFIVVI
jgi:Ran GTPase-activating protein (RanGAP) involved in mRNA processing and transport